MNSTTPPRRRQASRPTIMPRRHVPMLSTGISAVTVSSWGDVVMRIWTHAISHGEATLSRPFEIWQLTPLDAATVHMFTRTLVERAAVLGEEARVRVCVSTRGGRIPGTWRAAPEMRAWIKDGTLAPLNRFTEEGTQHSEHEHGTRPAASLNLVAMFAHSELSERALKGFAVLALDDRSQPSESDLVLSDVGQSAMNSDSFTHAALVFDKNTCQAPREVTALVGSCRSVDIDQLATIMKTVVVHGNGDQSLAVLKLANCDPRVFAAAGTGLMNHLADDGSDRGAWAQTLTHVWARHLASTTKLNLGGDLVRAAMAIDAWGLARQMLERGMTFQGETAADLTLLASCEAQTGHLDKACALAARALAIDPGHVQANEVARHLLVRAGRFDNSWARRVSLPGIPVALEPLDVDHAQAFFRQYRDPQIAEMTRLREFAEVDDVRSWIHRVNSARNRHRYAVMHEDAGFVGYVSLRPSGPDAHFGFWIGVDHQGRGFGIHAGRLLCEFARYQGTKHMFAAVFDYNWRSIRALERIGFRSIALRPADEEDRRRFLCYSSSDDHSAETAFRDCLHREQQDLTLIAANGRVVRAEEDVE